MFCTEEDAEEFPLLLPPPLPVLLPLPRQLLRQLPHDLRPPPLQAPPPHPLPWGGLDKHDEQAPHQRSAPCFKRDFLLFCSVETVPTASAITSFTSPMTSLASSTTSVTSPVN
jgi:hypothetical protein